jgi:hypothetical protein
VKTIIEKCWEVDPEKRWSFGMSWEELEKIQFKVMGNPDEKLVQSYITQMCRWFKHYLFGIWNWGYSARSSPDFWFLAFTIRLDVKLLPDILKIAVCSFKSWSNYRFFGLLSKSNRHGKSLSEFIVLRSGWNVDRSLFTDLSNERVVWVSCQTYPLLNGIFQK